MIPIHNTIMKVHLRVFTTGDLCGVPIETLITLFTIKYCNSDVQILLVRDAKANDENSFLVDISTFRYKFIKPSELSKIASLCELPNLEENDRCCIAGLCATLRRIIKNVLVEDPKHYSAELLGFKESCLLACSEASIWTRFCEVDIVSMLRSTNVENQDGVLPVTLARFERHMSQPTKLHNIYKYTTSKKFIGNAAVKQERSIPEHTFAEGFKLTLSDVIIFACIHVFFTYIDKKQIRDFIPLTLKWYENMLLNEHILGCLDILSTEDADCKNVIVSYALPHVENQSLYKSDPKRYKPRNRIYTKQGDIDYSLSRIREFDVKVQLDEVYGREGEFDWTNVPYDATPEGGSLPGTRLQRKFQQLESLCKPVLKLAKDNHTIVDFCSGGGHLGILLAYLLPECSIVLLENKPESMKKAKERVVNLQLSNVTFCQSNLDYFTGDFDIGTCLHACGVATDLVLQQCIEKSAAFVCCPCCYGSVQDCHRVVYPRSQAFKNILDKRSYLVLGHAADQTHKADNFKTKQGYECMMMIDTDRRMQAEEHGYEVRLNKLSPESCSPKNHVLVGWPSRLAS